VGERRPWLPGSRGEKPASAARRSAICSIAEDAGLDLAPVFAIANLTCAVGHLLGAGGRDAAAYAAIAVGCAVTFTGGGITCRRRHPTADPTLYRDVEITVSEDRWSS